MPRPAATNTPALKDLQELTRLLVGVAMRMSATDEAGLSLTQLRTLDALELFGTTKARLLADRVGVHASTMSRTCQQLKRIGLVSQEPNPDSGREVLICLTREGSKAMARADRRRKASLNDILRRVPAEDMPEVTAALRVLAAAAAEAYEDSADGV
jgi:DNA-binding MarR family transcriptional regulator